MADGTVVEIATAKVRIIRGLPDATGRAFAVGCEQHLFHAGRPSRLVVGSDESASWRLARADVAPRQLDIVWDGSQLWLQDALRLGRTFVNGRTLNEWVVVDRQAIVVFGGVQLWLLSRAKPNRSLAPDFDALDRARLTDAHQAAKVRLCDTSRIVVPPELVSAFNERGAP